MRNFWSRFCRLLPVAATVLLAGCHGALLHPAGPIGMAERSIIYTATGLMLVVVAPVIVLVVLVAWHYRASNTKARYEPEWSHSTRIEVVMWSIPVVIVSILGVIAWRSSHKLDPFRHIASPAQPIHVEAVAMDWKWLFIYPDLHIASVNEVAMPVGVPVIFHITSATVMNSFFIPRLGSQIYAMANMQTSDNLVASRTGTFRGISANFSGNGFSGMTFKAISMTPANFKQWVAKVSASSQHLDAAQYVALDKPSENVPVTYYSHVMPSLFEQILAGKFRSGQLLASASAPAPARGSK